MKTSTTCLCTFVLLLVGIANAGFIQSSIDVDMPDPGSPHGPPSWAGPPDFVFELVPGQAGNGMMKLTELFGGPETLAHVVSGLTDVDPVMTITKSVTNDSGFAWTGYEVALPDNGGITFVGTPTSDTMILTSQSDYQLLFGEPQAVAHGETVQFVFDVLIPSTGPFSFTLTQTPIPEPASLTLLSIGGIALIRHRRRA